MDCGCKVCSLHLFPLLPECLCLSLSLCLNCKKYFRSMHCRAHSSNIPTERWGVHHSMRVLQISASKTHENIYIFFRAAPCMLINTITKLKLRVRVHCRAVHLPNISLMNAPSKVALPFSHLLLHVCCGINLDSRHRNELSLRLWVERVKKISTQSTTGSLVVWKRSGKG